MTMTAATQKGQFKASESIRKWYTRKPTNEKRGIRQNRDQKPRKARHKQDHDQIHQRTSIPHVSFAVFRAGTFPVDNSRSKACKTAIFT